MPPVPGGNFMEIWRYVDKIDKNLYFFIESNFHPFPLKMSSCIKGFRETFQDERKRFKYLLEYPPVMVTQNMLHTFYDIVQQSGSMSCDT